MTPLATSTDELRSAFEFAGMPEGWLRLLGLLLLGAMCYAVVWLYRREGRAGASAGVRMTLGALRCAVLLSLALIWLQPVIATYTKRTIRAAVAVLIDDSASMSIHDTPADADAASSQETRSEKVRKLLTAPDEAWQRDRIDRGGVAKPGLLDNADFAWLKRLAETNELAVYSFGEHVRRLQMPWEPPTSQPTTDESSQTVPLVTGLTARQNHTDLGQGFARVLDDAGESPIAAVVLISDGIVNQGLSDDDAAAYVRTFKAPVYAVGVGGPVEPPNARVTNFSAPAAISKGDPLELRVEVGAAGIEPMPLRVELLARPVATGPDGTPTEERLVGEREVTLGGELPPSELLFKVPAEVGGEFLYRARVASVPNEAVEFDNVRAAAITVLDEKLRVLLIAGRPTYDYRAVTALLGRDKTIDLSCWLQSADPQSVRDGTTIISELPRKAEEIFEYDAIILMDPDPREFDSAWAVTVRRLVDELGGGICLQAGPLYSSRFMRDERLTDLVSLLPIQADPDADVRLSERGSFSTQLTQMRVPDEARAHPALALSSETSLNRAIWDALPGVWWYWPVLREKPAAAVLLRTGGGSASDRGGAGSAVLMAAQPFGAGRSVYLGFDSTWRWRATGERAFNRFWVQMVRYLAQARRQGVSRRGTITLDRESINVGEYIRIEARVLDPTFAPWHEAEIPATIQLSDGRVQDVQLSAIPSREGWYSGRVAPEQDGPAVIRIALPGGEVSTRPPTPGDNSPAGAPGDAESLVKHLSVQRPDVEMRTLRLRSEVLNRLAETTRGRFVTIDAAGALPDWIENASLVRPIEGPKHDLWDRTWVLFLISALLGVEWYVRRRNHLL